MLGEAVGYSLCSGDEGRPRLAAAAVDCVWPMTGVLGLAVRPTDAGVLLEVGQQRHRVGSLVCT